MTAAGSDPFAASRERLDVMVGRLEDDQAAAMTHAELEDFLQVQGRGLIRQLVQDHLDLRAAREPRLPAAGVVDADGITRPSAEGGHTRALATVFGEVQVCRIAYRAPGRANLHPADGVLNLPTERHSHGLRRLAAMEAARGSFDDAVAAIGRSTGCELGKRQVEQLAGRAAVDFDAFYHQRCPPAGHTSDVLGLSCDGKGVVMRHDALRPHTRRAAETGATKLTTRLSRGEKRNRKRSAEIGAVFDITPAARTPADVLARSHDDTEPAPTPVTTGKWLTASVADDAAAVVGHMFTEAERRDPDHHRTWIALVDGNNHQIDQINAEARDRNVDITILVDFVHVLEYLWKAAWCFHHEGDRAAETWVHRQALAVLNGNPTRVAGLIRRTATITGLTGAQRKQADTAANYLTNKACYLDYPTALRSGWQIATGVIEGACRHLVKDRMDITGARWGLTGAETILKLRALRANGDFDDYWQYHLTQERQRTHQSRYLNQVIPEAA